MANAFEIRRMALELARGEPTLTTGHHVRPYVREQLEILATSAGLPHPYAPKALDNDLISIYLVALKDGAAAQRVAAKVAVRLDDSLLGTPGQPPTRAPYKPDPKQQFEPLVRDPGKFPDPRQDPINGAPFAAPGPPTPGLEAIRDLIKREVREGALDPLQAALAAMDSELREYSDDRNVQLQAATLDMMRAQIDTAAHAAAAEAIKAIAPTRLDVTINHEPVRNLGLVHKQTPKIIATLSAGVNVYLHGPAGSGKTTAASKCADAFALAFYFAAKVESEYQLIGFKDAKGDTVRTQFREAYEHGGVFLFDEMDASSPSAVVAMNAALANGVCPFPDGTIKRHADFYCIGAGNTKLTGATRQYAGRSQLDAASIDRFAFIEFNYDDELERALATDPVWCTYVQAVRKAVAERGLNHLVTPRATYDGCKLLAKGLDWDEVAGMVVYKGLDSDTIKQIQNAVDYSKAEPTYRHTQSSVSATVTF